MARLNFKQLAEVFGLTAIVLSLVFVGLQLRQDRVFARGELGAVAFDHAAELDAVLTDTEFADIYVKMLRSPADLSEAEMTSVNAFLDQVLTIIARDCYLMDVGIYDECDEFANVVGARFFGSSYAKAWWNSTKGTRRPTVVSRTSKVIDSLSDNDSARIYEEIKEQL